MVKLFTQFTVYHLLYYNVTAQNRTFYCYTPNVQLYHHVLERVNACIATSSVVVRHACNLVVEKMEGSHETLSQFTHTKVYSPLPFLSCRWEIETAYENWATRVSWTKTITSCGEREDRNRVWIFFLVFCCSSHDFVLLFCLQKYTSGERFFFGSHPKNEAVIFVCLYIFVTGI